MQEEVDQKTIALAVKTGKLTAQVLQAAIRKYLAARQKGTGKAHHGQQSLRQLKKDGSALSNIEITDANICTPVSPEQAKPGDLVFFVGTYDTAGMSHVGLYVGNSVMLHCGDPISYTNLNSSYWQQHFYCYGRLP